MEVLGVEVGPELLRSWASWLAPDPQPFLVEDPAAWEVDGASPAGVMTRELRDTYCLWRVEKGTPIVWLTEEGFGSLPRDRRAALVREQFVRGRGAVPSVQAWRSEFDANRVRAQADGHRFVWWPSLVTPSVAVADVVRTSRFAGQRLERHTINDG